MLATVRREALRREEELQVELVNVLESMTNAFMAFDREWRITYVNAAAEHIDNTSRESLRGRSAWEVFPAAAETIVERELRRAMAKRATVKFEYFYEPSARWFEIDAYPVKDGGLAVHGRDVSERKRAEEALRRAHDELEQQVFQRTEQILAANAELVKQITERERVEEDLKRAHATTTEILESITDGFTAWDQNWRYIYVNERSAQLLGKSKDQLIGQSVWELFPEAVGTEAYHKCQQAMADRVPLYFEACFSNRWYENYLYPTKEGLSVYWREITERKRAEEKLRRSEAYLAEAQRLSHTGSWAWYVSTGELFWSAEHFRILGLDPEKTPPSYPTALQCIHPEDRSFVQRTLEGALRARSDFHVNCRIIRPDGTIRYIDSFARPVFNDASELSEYVGTIIDITERKQSEQTLQENQQRLRVALESSSVAFTILRAVRDESSHITDFEWLYLNPVAAQIIGCAPEELIGRRVRQVLPDGWEPPGLFDCFVQVVSTDEPRNIEIASRRNGVDAWFHNIAAKHGDGVAVWFADVTERKRVEDKLRRSEAFLAEGQRISRTGSWAVKFLSEDVFWSDEMYRIYGLNPATTEVSQQLAFELIHPEDRRFVREAFEQALRDQRDYAVEHRAMLPDGSLKHLHALGHPVLNESGDLIEYVGTVVDITERKQADEALHKVQAELAHISRVTMMGELAASIVHEINQPLGAIVNNSNACLGLFTRSAAQRQVREALLDIVSDADRATSIIARIRALSKRTPPEKTSLTVEKVIGDVVTLTHQELMERHIEVRTEIADGLPSVSSDRVQLQQVLLNLLMNAIDAMRDVNKERWLVTIGAHRGELEGRAMVVITVEDLGCGFEPDDAERVFESFYTTKPDGLGMGLRISRSIVEAHGGRLWATSNAGPGATFHCALPVEE